MMKKKLLVLPLIMLLLAGCSGKGSDTSSGESTSEGSTSQTSNSDDPGGHDIKIKFYLDFNHYDKENPYHQVWWDSDTTFTKEQIGLVDPTTAPDPYYPTFLGWSKYAIVDEDARLWNFGVDKIQYSETAGGTFEIFGIFVGK